MKKEINSVRELKIYWGQIRSQLQKRLNEFKDIWKKGTDKDIFNELVFCLFTPQSKAKSCWAAVEGLKSCGLVLKGAKNEVSKKLNSVRFKNNKAGYLIEARKYFCIKENLNILRSSAEKRGWLVKNIKGFGLKEASHFLRNIGFYDELAILDRHILRNLKFFGVIKNIPKSLTKTTYFEIEKKMIDFSKKIGIPLSHLDLLLWCKETGEVFK
jgi:N-glycosylase/DNA lyase